MEKQMTNTVSRIISDDALSRIIQIESAGNPNAKAKTSSATGLGQFIDGTWTAVVQRHRPDLLKGRTRAEVLAMRKDPSLAVELLARFTEDNAAALGKGYGDGDLYLAHFAGVGTARKILQAFPATPVSKIVSAQAIDANPSILRGKTCAQVREWATKKMAAAGGHDWVAKWYRGKPSAGPQTTASAGKAAAGSAAIVTASTFTTAAHQGFGLSAWIVIGVALLLLIGAAYFGWRWWKNRKATAIEPFEWSVGEPTAPVARDSKALQTLTSTPIWKSETTTTIQTKSARKPAAKRPAKRKAKRKAA